MPLTQPIAEFVRQRAAKGYRAPLGQGIATRDVYLKSLRACIGGNCALIEGPTPGALEAATKEAAGQLAFHTDGMVVTDTDFDLIAEKQAEFTKEALQKSLPDMAAGVLEHVSTTTRRDRDRDILETSGATVDMAGPLLLQHVPFNLIGKVLAVVKHTSTKLVERSAILDNATGRDLMMFVRFGAFRISIGFLPDLNSLELLDPNNEYGGVRVGRYEIVERSLVSIPSNVDAELLGWAAKGEKSFDPQAFDAFATVYSRHHNTLETDLFKQWSGSVFRQRTPQAPGISLKPAEPTCGCKAKAAEPPAKATHAERPERWNKALSEKFDASLTDLEPATVLLEMIGQHLGAKMHEIHREEVFVPSHRLGPFLYSLRQSMENWTVTAMRNINTAGEEAPLDYERIELKPGETDEFLVNGTLFVSGPNKAVIRLSAFWAGLEIRHYSRRGEHAAVQKLLDDTWTKAKGENNFLRGQSFSLSGQFIPKTAETWDDLFLEPGNQNAVQRTINALNEKGASAANRGLLMLGPPGTGKTLSGRVTLNTAKATFIWVAARDLYYSGGFGGLESAFKLARELAPAVIFVEDVDNHLDGYAIDLLKSEMDGIGRSGGVVTMLTTNFPERVPEALIDRPGRFHDVLKFDLPAEGVRGKMLEKWLPGISQEAKESLVEGTKGMSGAHVYELCAFAKTLATESGEPLEQSAGKALSKVIEQRELIQSIKRPGTFRPSRTMHGEFQKLYGRGPVLLTKGGRALSKASETALREAQADVDEIAAMDIPRAAKSLAKSASASIAGVLKTVQPEPEADAQPVKAEEWTVEKMQKTDDAGLIGLHRKLSACINAVELEQLNRLSKGLATRLSQ